ncbi:apses-domain-containing protein, partial [Gonapodya prolifera JEL478]
LCSAVYSNIPVYELHVKDVAVMRRVSDAFLNATQILKVAGFSKPRRTKILEREVLADPLHEKIQGGYGKYQGTWIPLDSGRDLARRYGVEDLVAPLLDF